MLNWMPSKH